MGEKRSSKQERKDHIYLCFCTAWWFCPGSAVYWSLRRILSPAGAPLLLSPLLYQSCYIIEMPIDSSLIGSYLLLLAAKPSGVVFNQ